jgi:transcriptional regulator of nitric oxide reductase/ferredoxin
MLPLLLRASDAAGELSQTDLANLVMPAYQLGELLEPGGVWTIKTPEGEPAGYVFESLPRAPIPGFAGKPMNLLIMLDNEGRFLRVTVLEQNEPIFISGLGQEPFDDFLEQYRDLSVFDSITLGTANRAAQGAGSTHVYLDGISMATASVRIANESILASALQVSRERMKGLEPVRVSLPRRDYVEALDWKTLVEEGIAHPLIVSNRQLQDAFAGSSWENHDPEALADPDGTYLDMWLIDIGPPSIARAVLSPETMAALNESLRPYEEPILVLANGRHRLVDDDFVRNTEPNRISGIQGEFPVAFRDADLETTLASGMPDFEQAMILRADTRLGFDPASPWTLIVRVIRKQDQGVFGPPPGVRDFEIAHHAPARFFDIPAEVAAAPPWLAALKDRAVDLAVFAAFVGVLIWLLAGRMTWLARHPRYRAIRLSMLAFMVVFVGFWAQGQLSIVTPVGIVSSIVEGRSLVFLLYEPFILAVWAVTLVTLVVYGRGFFCGWLCPYGALQEFAYAAGRKLRLPKIRVHPWDDRRLKRVKYIVLALLIAASFASPVAADYLVELEPFKTAITLMFDRGPPFVVYALFWLVLGAFLFKGFCRYVCPLGAVLAIAGKFRRLDWIARRSECGSPCQFCKAKCDYGAIEADGRIDYDECFQCLDCVTIIETPSLCVPERIALRKQRRGMSEAAE